MKRQVGWIGILLLVSVLAVAVSAETQIHAFGFGGSMAMSFFPNMDGINTFMSENGLPPMSEFLIGAGGSGRGGVIGGPTFGGIGWGIFAESKFENRKAELVFGGGGFDLGAAIGGDEGSVLAIGAVLGAGANVMSITVGPEGSGDDGDGDNNWGPCGLVIEPSVREFGRAFAFVQPYISMAAEILPWMGFEFRVGYIFPAFGFDFGDQVGIPAPSLELSGPTVSFGITFGGIASSRIRDMDELDLDMDLEMDIDVDVSPTVTVSRGGSFSLEGAEELVIENAAGEIRVDSYRAETEATGTGPIVQWTAEITGEEEDLEAVDLQMSVDGLTATFQTATGDGSRFHAVEATYTLLVPAGIDLKIKNGAGLVAVVGHEAPTVILENGVGEMEIKEVQATSLIATTGIGRIRLSQVEAEGLIAETGIGGIELELLQDTSASLFARSSLGDVEIDRFPGMIGGVRGFIGGKADVTLGEGEDRIELKVGIGSIDVTIQDP